MQLVQIFFQFVRTNQVRENEWSRSSLSSTLWREESSWERRKLMRENRARERERSRFSLSYSSWEESFLRQRMKSIQSPVQFVRENTGWDRECSRSCHSYSSCEEGKIDEREHCSRSLSMYPTLFLYTLATIGSLIKIIGLFCRIWSLL